MITLNVVVLVYLVVAYQLHNGGVAPFPSEADDVYD